MKVKHNEKKGVLTTQYDINIDLKALDPYGVFQIRYYL